VQFRIGTTPHTPILHHSARPDSRTRTRTKRPVRSRAALKDAVNRKQPKIDALRQYKEEILEAHRSGLSIHRIAQIFRERGVDISVPNLVRTVQRFVDEEERAGKGSPASHGPTSPMTKERHPESTPEETKSKAPVTYQVPEQPSARVQEEEFAKQLRLARYLAAGGSSPSRPLEPPPKAKAPKRGRPVAKAGAIKPPGKKLGRKNWPRRDGGRDEPAQRLGKTQGRSNRPLEDLRGDERK
jgi:hypothetical protein